MLEDDAERGGCGVGGGCPRERGRDGESVRFVVDDVDVGSGRGIWLEDDGPEVGARGIADWDERRPCELGVPALLDGARCAPPRWLDDGREGWPGV